MSEEERITITLEGVVIYSKDFSIHLDNLIRVISRHLFIQFPTFHPVYPFITVTTNKVSETDNQMLVKCLEELKKSTPEEIEAVRKLGTELKSWAEEQMGARGIVDRLKILWWDSSVGFDCLCGENKEIIMDDEGGQKTCDVCGRVYAFGSKLELVKDAEIAKGDP